MSGIGNDCIVIDGLVKHFRVHRRQAGLGASLRGLIRRHYDMVRAVDDISFAIATGEVVGFLGPNGAGKTTTLKCLSGLLHPSAGRVRVLGHEPARREREFLGAITLVMGQRNQLFWDLPAMETFLVNQAIYRVPPTRFRTALDGLVALLELEDLLDKQVRQLSLGERMRCELAAALLHEPQVLFLDEPTLGLDVAGQAAIRTFLAAYAAERGATILLTSHYMADVTALASRVVLIDDGTLRYDGSLADLVATYSPYRLVRVTLEANATPDTLAVYGEVASVDGPEAVLRVAREATRDVASRLLAELPVVDVSIQDVPLEDIIRQVFAHD